MLFRITFSHFHTKIPLSLFDQKKGYRSLETNDLFSATPMHSFDVFYGVDREPQ